MKKLLYAVFFISSVALSYSADVQFSGSAETKAGAYAPWTDNAGTFSEGTEKIVGNIDASTDTTRLYISGEVLADACSKNVSAEIKELNFSWTSSTFADQLQFSFLVGRQLVSWGKADSIIITDVLCPQDMTTISGTDFSESRLGIDALKLSLSGTSFSVDTFFIPFFKSAKLPLEETNPLRATLIPSSVTITNNSIPVTVGILDEPELNLENASYAGRLSFWLSYFDFSLYAFYGYDSMPTPNYSFDGSKIEVSGDYHQYSLFGFDAAIPAGDFVIRTEVATSLGKALSTTKESVIAGSKHFITKNQIKALIGVDWIQGDWQITAQYVEDIVLDYEQNIERKEREPQSTLSVARTFLQGNLSVEFAGMISWNDFDYALQLTTEYSLSDEITLSLTGLGFFAGPENDGTYGAYKDISAITVSGIYRF